MTDRDAGYERTLLAFRHSSHAAILVAPDAPRWTILEVNEAYLAVTHRVRDELIGQPLFVAFPESPATTDDRGSGRIAASFEDALRGRHALLSAQRYDLPLASGGFEAHFWDFSTTALYGSDGQAIALLHEVEDVSLRERGSRERARLMAELAERNVTLSSQGRELELTNQQLQENAAELEAQTEELQATAAQLEERTEEAESARARAETERLRTEEILETMADAHFEVDADFRFTRVNAAMERGAQLPRANMLGRTIWEVFPLTVGTAFERSYRAAAAGLESHFTHDYSDGRLDLIVEVDAYPAKGGGIAVFWRDVTARAKAEEALRESERQLRAFANGLPTLAWSARPDGYIEWYNERWYEYTGTTPAQMEGWGWKSVHHPTTLARVLEQWTRSIETGAPFEMVFPLRAAAGEFRRFLTRVTPVRNQSGVIVRWFGVNTDIEEAQAAREAVQTVVEAVTDGFVAVDRNLRYTYVNSRASEMWELPAQSFIGRTPFEMWPNLDMNQSPFVKLFRRVLGSRQTDALEAYAPSLGRWIQTRAYPSADGGIVVFFQDITERRRAEEGASILADASRLLASSTDYAETLANVARAVVPRLGDWSAVDLLTDPASTAWPPVLERVAIVHDDPNRLALAAELARRYPERWDDPDGQSQVIRDGRSMFVPDISDEMIVAGAVDEEHLHLLRVLELTSLMVVPIAARGRVLGALTLCMTESRRHYVAADLAVAEDIGRRAGVALDTVRLLREAQEARIAAEVAAARTTRLQHVTALLSEALTEREVATLVVCEGAPAFGAKDGVIYLLSEDSRTLTFAASMGVPDPTRREFERLPLDADLPLPEAIRTRTSVVLESREEVLQRYPVLAEANARAATVSWIAVPLIAGEVALGGMVLGFHEARRFSSEDRSFAETLARLGAQALLRARLFQEAERARAIAEEANAAKMAFLATMSHELRTPLNAISGHVQLMEMGLHGPVSEAQREALGRVDRAQAHLLGLINDILTYAKVESGRIDYTIAPVDGVEVIREVCRLVEPQFLAKRIELKVALPDGKEAPVLVQADREKLQQILLNLISNSWKFTASGGTVVVRVRDRSSAAGHVEIAVTDTGVGVPPDKLESIFEPFVQLGRALSSSHEGTGLGLAISRDLARGMGGELSVESTTGEGSTFTVTLRQ